eukprot:GABU01005271.1.p2 GENE.GABU01005271.1~~GABU01005271.1.p2  ORF type:complete len:249 (-),score=47.52 GABU01005271.1:33-779(-)
MLFWMVKSVFTWSKLSISTAVCLWYHDQSEGCGAITRGAFWSTRYHLGTIYFAALVLNLATALQRSLEYIESKSRIASTSASLWLRAIGCIGSLIAQFIETFTSQALTEVALTSDSLCKSGSRVSTGSSMNMIAKNSPVMLLFSFAKLLVSALVTIQVHLELRAKHNSLTLKDFASVESIKNLLMMTPTMLVVFLVSWITASIYCYVWETVAETLINLKSFEHMRGAPQLDKVEDQLSATERSIQYAQ